MKIKIKIKMIIIGMVICGDTCVAVEGRFLGIVVSHDITVKREWYLSLFSFPFGSSLFLFSSFKFSFSLF